MSHYLFVMDHEKFYKISTDY